MTKFSQALAGLFAVSFASIPALAETVDFAFTGSGATMMASGTFSIDDDALEQQYWGMISPYAAVFDVSLQLSDLSGQGAMTLEPTTIFFGMDSGGVARIIPGGRSSFGTGYYDLSPNTDFASPEWTGGYHSQLYVVTGPVPEGLDDITWSPAVAVPEPISVAMLAFGAVLMFRRSPSPHNPR